MARFVMLQSAYNGKALWVNPEFVDSVCADNEAKGAAVSFLGIGGDSNAQVKVKGSPEAIVRLLIGDPS